MSNSKALQVIPPLCDVVVVNYNSGEFLARCVESVLRSDMSISLTIVDNASSDDSIARINGLDAQRNRLQIIENEENLGFAKAVNIGASAGRAPFILLLNPDCEIFPHTIKNLLAETRYCKDFGILGALVFNEDGTEQRGCRRLEPTFTRSMVTALRLDRYFESVNLQYTDLPDRPQSIDAVSGSSMLISRPLFEQLGGMDEDYFLHVEDLDICRRAREHGKKVYFTPNVSLFHYHGASHHGVPYRTEWYKHQGMLRYQEKFQKPHQSRLRSLLTRGMIYVNFAASISRHFLFRRGSMAPIASRLVDNQKPIIITGANSDLGGALLNDLDYEGPVIAFSRKTKYPEPVGNERWFNWSYLEKVPAADFPGVSTWIALSPVWAAPGMAETIARLGEVKRIIALSSTSIMGKADTADPGEQDVVQRLKEGEKGILEWSRRNGADITICRASMIYGGKSNRNIAFIRRMINLFGFFPMPSEGNGRRQPVHVEDLAHAIGILIEKRNLPADTYILAGGEQLSYRRMVARVFEAQGHKPRFWTLSGSGMKRLIRVLSVLPGFGFLNSEMIARMEQDMVYDIEPARRDFQYAPGMFRP